MWKDENRERERQSEPKGTTEEKKLVKSKQYRRTKKANKQTACDDVILCESNPTKRHKQAYRCFASRLLLVYTFPNSRNEEKWKKTKRRIARRSHKSTHQRNGSQRSLTLTCTCLIASSDRWTWDDTAIVCVWSLVHEITNAKTKCTKHGVYCVTYQ